jgi:hypothetical protein
MPRNYRFALIHLHWLGLDIAVASLATHIAANRLADGTSETSFWQSLLVGLGSWGTYLLYYQFDNRRAGRPASPRSSFHATYHSELRKLGGVALILAAALFWLTPQPLWPFILAFSVGLGLFVWLINRLPLKRDLRAIKEPMTALLYTGGTWASSWFTQEVISWESMVLGGALLLAVLQNFLITAHFEAIRYKGTYNLARWLRKANSKKVVYGIAILVLALGVWTIYLTEFRYSQRLSVFIIAMAWCPIIIMNNAEKVVMNDRYEFLIKLVLLLPILAL